MSRKKQATLADHQRWGKALKRARTLVQHDVLLELGGYYPYNGLEHRRLGQAMRAIENLRNVLDSAVFRENREGEFLALARCYYGPEEGEVRHEG